MNGGDHLRRVLPVVLVGAALAGIGVCVALWGVYVAHGRTPGSTPTTVFTGAAAMWAAISLICFGAALLGPLFRSKALVATWMALWLVAGVAVRFVEPAVCTKPDRMTTLCE